MAKARKKRREVIKKPALHAGNTRLAKETISFLEYTKDMDENAIKTFVKIDKEEIKKRLDKTKFYKERIPSLQINGKPEAVGLCPFHNDTNPSLSVNLDTGLYRCYACGAKGDVFTFYQETNGVDFLTTLEDLAVYTGVTDASKSKVVATFNYTDENGNILYRKKRIEPGKHGKSKDFVFEHPEGSKWVAGRGCDPVTYRLHEIISAKEIFIVEGEGKADLLHSWGLAATCLDSGANSKWIDSYSQHFTGKNVVILPDNDAPGRKYALEIAKALHGRTYNIKIVELPCLSEKGDIIDWAAMPGNNKSKLVTIVENTDIWTPEVVKVDKPNGLTMGLTHASDLLSEVEEETDWLIEGLLPSGGFSVITAKPKVGKSTLVKQMALHIAKGDPFLDRRCVQGAVIYLALEDKRAEIRKHLKAMGMTGDDPFYLYSGGAPLDAIKRITADIANIKPVLLVIDTLFRLIRLKDGNSYNEVTNALDPLIQLARSSGVSILAIHHSKKGESDVEDCLLGSTAIFGSVDTTILLKRYEGYRTIQSRQRYGDDMLETVLVFDKASGMTDIGGAKEGQDIRLMENAILEFLEKQVEPVDEKTIHSETTGSCAPRKKALRELVNSGRISRTGEGKKGHPFLYSGTPEKGGTARKTETPYQHFDQKNDPKKDSGTLVRRYTSEPQKRNDKSGYNPHGCKEDSGTLVRSFKEDEKESAVPPFLDENPILNSGENPDEDIPEVEFLEVK
ncbi:MAG: AAA family ATPase [Candidatus Kuenenia stuttgartiensis]|nr:AAA family ATPase [Candidatus Kuenenia stuttgartiensis]GJQ48030.1 MAG: hypothetical protein HKUEN01_04160 [Candidatus Kuenenia stuttgartiensis]